MGVIIPENYGEFTWFFGGDADPEAMLTSLGVFLPDVGSMDPVASVDNAYENLETTLLPLISSAYSLTRCQLKVGHGEDPPELYEHIETVVGGDGTGAPLSQNTATLVRKVTGVGGRKHRGRMYIPGLVDANEQSTIGVIAGTVLTATQAAVDDFYDAVLAESEVGIIVVLHSLITDTPTEVISLQVQPVLSTQRRRLRP